MEFRETGREMRSLQKPICAVAVMVAATSVAGCYPMAGSSPNWDLTTAAEHGDVAGVKAALAAKANINSGIGDGGGETALGFAAANDRLDVIRMLIAAGADVNAGNSSEGSTPLQIAAYVHPEAVRALIGAGANINVVDVNGETPLHRAAFRGQTDSVRALLEAGAKVDGETRSGWTPLMDAAEFDHLDAARLLLEAGADANGPMTHRGMPLVMAENHNDTPMAELLRQHGAHE